MGRSASFAEVSVGRERLYSQVPKSALWARWLGLKHTKQKCRNGEIRVIHTLNRVHRQRTCEAIVIRTR
jgi:hypothetical protein